MELTMKKSIMQLLWRLLFLLVVHVAKSADIPKGCEVEENELSCVGKSLKYIPILSSDLEGVYLSQNNITEVDNLPFQFSENLKELDLSINLIRKVTNDAFKPLKELRTLFLNSNKLQYINLHTFEWNIKLEKLFLSNNPLHFPKNEIFLKSTSLLELSIAYCNISTLEPVSLSKVPHLKKLDIRGHQLHYISRNVLDTVPELGKLIISELDQTTCFGQDWQNVSDYMKNKQGEIYLRICQNEFSDSLKSYTKDNLILILSSVMIVLLLVLCITSLFLYLKIRKTRNYSSEFFPAHLPSELDKYESIPYRYRRMTNRLSSATCSTRASSCETYVAPRHFSEHIPQYELILDSLPTMPPPPPPIQ